MPNVTVTAADTATAMDEIWDRLGPDAMIVSTKKQQGKIVMEATTEAAAKPAEPARASTCLLYTSPSPRDRQKSRMPSSA